MPWWKLFIIILIVVVSCIQYFYEEIIWGALTLFFHISRSIETTFYKISRSTREIFRYVSRSIDNFWNFSKAYFRILLVEIQKDPKCVIFGMLEYICSQLMEKIQSWFFYVFNSGISKYFYFNSSLLGSKINFQNSIFSFDNYSNLAVNTIICDLVDNLPIDCDPWFSGYVNIRVDYFEGSVSKSLIFLQTLVGLVGFDRLNKCLENFIRESIDFYLCLYISNIEDLSILESRDLVDETNIWDDEIFYWICYSLIFLIRNPKSQKVLYYKSYGVYYVSYLLFYYKCVVNFHGDNFKIGFRLLSQLTFTQFVEHYKSNPSLLSQLTFTQFVEHYKSNPSLLSQDLYFLFLPFLQYTRVLRCIITGYTDGSVHRASKFLRFDNRFGIFRGEEKIFSLFSEFFLLCPSTQSALLNETYSSTCTYHQPYINSWLLEFLCYDTSKKFFDTNTTFESWLYSFANFTNKNNSNYLGFSTVHGTISSSVNFCFSSLDVLDRKFQDALFIFSVIDYRYTLGNVEGIWSGFISDFGSHFDCISALRHFTRLGLGSYITVICSPDLGQFGFNRLVFDSYLHKRSRVLLRTSSLLFDCPIFQNVRHFGSLRFFYSNYSFPVLNGLSHLFELFSNEGTYNYHLRRLILIIWKFLSSVSVQVVLVNNLYLSRYFSVLIVKQNLHLVDLIMQFHPCVTEISIDRINRRVLVQLFKYFHTFSESNLIELFNDFFKLSRWFDKTLKYPYSHSSTSPDLSFDFELELVEKFKPLVLDYCFDGAVECFFDYELFLNSIFSSLINRHKESDFSFYDN